MGLLNSLFGNKSEEKKEVGKTINGVRYKDDLIDLLLEDHNSLFEIYGNIMEQLEKDDFNGIYDNLHLFKSELNMHIYIENTQLYTYVKNYFDSDISQLKFIEQVQQDMDGIAEAVGTFIDKWVDISISPENKDEFKAELEGIGKVLTKRTKMEESRLYTLYQN
jgi:regulator of sigma D